MVKICFQLKKKKKTFSLLPTDKQLFSSNEIKLCHVEVKQVCPLSRVSSSFFLSSAIGVSTTSKFELQTPKPYLRPLSLSLSALASGLHATLPIPTTHLPPRVTLTITTTNNNNALLGPTRQVRLQLARPSPVPQRFPDNLRR